MLVLTRKLNQSIMIGPEIEVKILAIEGEQVKLGISAPKHVEIHRQEIYLAIQEENQAATQLTRGLLQQLKRSQAPQDDGAKQDGEHDDSM